jgi:NAD(P)-dependent dehydrogenase (short-subunit alcohol dehydrogenase family)
MQLKDKVAVVLGASAEGGTGWAIAALLASAGAKIVVGARRREPLEQLAAKIGARAVVCDGGRGDQIAALARAAVDAFGPIDIAVNSAGQPMSGLISDISDVDIQRSLDINYIGQVHFIRHMAAAMIDGGAITLISSAVSTQPILGRFAYGCAKAAMDALVRYAAIEYGPRGIRVNSVLPGPLKTEMAAPIFAADGAEAAFAREIPLGRVGLPRDVADVVVWLSKAGYITGVNLPVSGGMHLTRLPRSDEIPSGLGKPVGAGD